MRVLYAVIGVFSLHVVEIWLFGLTYWAALQLPDTGGVHGAGAPGGAAGDDRHRLAWHGRTILVRTP